MGSSMDAGREADESIRETAERQRRIKQVELQLETIQAIRASVGLGRKKGGYSNPGFVENRVAHLFDEIDELLAMELFILKRGRST
jgi:hypothetical protein